MHAPCYMLFNGNQLKRKDIRSRGAAVISLVSLSHLTLCETVETPRGEMPSLRR